MHDRRACRAVHCGRARASPASPSSVCVDRWHSVPVTMSREQMPAPVTEPEPEPGPPPRAPHRVQPEQQVVSDAPQPPMPVLTLPKERGGRFFLAADGEDVNDSLLFTIGLFRFPTAGFYGGWFPTAEMLAVVKGSSISFPGLWLPPEVRAALPDGGHSAFEFFFIISDVGPIVAKHGHTLNLIHHAWLFPTAAPGKRTMGDVDVGVWSYPGSQVGPADKRGLGYNCLSRTRVSIHPQSAKKPDAGMCCSPNNARFTLQQPQPRDADGDKDDTAATGAVPGLSFFWSVAVAPRNGRDSSASEASQLAGRACVTLQLLLTEPEGPTSTLRQALNDAVEGCQTLQPLLSRLSDVLDTESARPAAAARAAQMTFGLERSQPWPGCVGAAQRGHAPSAAELEELNRGAGGERGQQGGASRGSRLRGIGGGANLVCSSCTLSCSASDFSKSQLGKGERRRCQQCTAGGQPLQSGQSRGRAAQRPPVAGANSLDLTGKLVTK